MFMHHKVIECMAQFSCIFQSKLMLNFALGTDFGRTILRLRCIHWSRECKAYSEVQDRVKHVGQRPAGNFAPSFLNPCNEQKFKAGNKSSRCGRGPGECPWQICKSTVPEKRLFFGIDKSIKFEYNHMVIISKS